MNNDLDKYAFLIVSFQQFPFTICYWGVPITLKIVTYSGYIVSVWLGSPIIWFMQNLFPWIIVMTSCLCLIYCLQCIWILNVLRNMKSLYLWLLCIWILNVLPKSLLWVINIMTSRNETIVGSIKKVYFRQTSNSCSPLSNSS